MPKSTKKQDAPVTRPAHHRTAIGQAQRAKTRAWIIQCAIGVFAERGPDAPVIDDFAKAAGVARSTFYSYFQTTHELLDATMATLSDEVIASVVPVVADEPDPLLRLATAAWMYYSKATADPLLGAFLGSVSSIGALAAEHAREDLRLAIEAGSIKIKDIDLAEAIAHGIMVFSLRTPSARNVGNERALAVIEATLAALGASPGHIDAALEKIRALPYAAPPQA